jgi:hypothetical protein
VREEAVDRQPEQIAVQFLKPIIGLGERNELTRADGREVGRVSEEDQPASAVVLKAPLALSRASMELFAGGLSILASTDIRRLARASSGFRVARASVAIPPIL